MARPLRILLPGGRYHVMNRGHRRSDLFLNDADRQRFLRLLAQLPERFGVELHAFVLMDNHYHLLLRTAEPNLSQKKPLGSCLDIRHKAYKVTPPTPGAAPCPAVWFPKLRSAVLPVTYKALFKGSSPE
jgi:REP element-mobilizing transposase RayT